MTRGLSPIDLSGREGLMVMFAREVPEYTFSGAVGPGAQMPSERKLAEALGVGRSVLREALKYLGLLAWHVHYSCGGSIRSRESAPNASVRMCGEGVQ